MPSFSHEALVELVRRAPNAIVTLLVERLHLATPPFDAIELASSDLGAALAVERRADVVLRLASKGRLVAALVIEVQLGRDERKRFSWPDYAVGLRGREAVPVAVVVIAPRRGVATWARRPIDLGFGNVFRPVVLGPEAIPVVDALDAALEAPELAVLSAIAHGRDEVAQAARIGVAAHLATVGLVDERGLVYSDLVRQALSTAARRAMEAIVFSLNGYEFKSDYVRGIIQRELDAARAEAIQEGLEQGLAQGLEQGLAQGLGQGLEQGLEQGREQGRARALLDAALRVLEARGIPLDDAVRARLEALRDPRSLEALVARAVVVAHASELLDVL